jgi:hypothetical protein
MRRPRPVSTVTIHTHQTVAYGETTVAYLRRADPCHGDPFAVERN